MSSARALLALLLALSLSGCDETSTGGAATPGGLVLYKGSESASVPQTKTEIVDALKDAVASPSGNLDNQQGRALFDGDTRLLGATDGAVSTGGADFTKTQKVVLPLDKPVKKKGDEPPAPDMSLPLVTLPAPADGEGPQGANAAFRGYFAFQKMLYDAAYPMLGRLGWGARDRRGADVAMTPYRVTVHHTASGTPMSEEATIKSVRAIQNFHMDGRTGVGKENFDDIGYHFLIDGEGRVIEGRSPDVMGAHARGANVGNIGVAMMGDFNVTKPTSAQVDSLERLVVFLAVKYRHDPANQGFLEGHKHYDPTSCPGANLVKILDDLRVRIDAEADNVVKKLGPTAPVDGSGFVPMIVTQTP